MSGINAQKRAYLEGKFGKRISFFKRERKLYGHDIAAFPKLIRPLIGDTTPDGVVQPETEEELVEMVRWAVENRMPLTPRGKATSGYGGVLPIKKGLMVDFYRLNRLLHIDPNSLTARVQAGIVWENLDRELMKHGLTLRLYPTSYPSSTAGGWLAQGGGGIGSYEFGWFRENVVSARAVMPDGTVKEFSGSDLDLIADAEGITGLISDLTIRVQPKENLEVVAIGCPDPHEVQRLLESMIAEKLPIWSLMFINPRMAEMRNRAPLMEHLGHPAEERVLLPASYVITLTYRTKDQKAVTERLPALLKACAAEILSDRIARHEWQNRFRIMTVKRLGPSLVPAESVVPLSAFGDAMEKIGHQVNQPVVREGVVIRDGANGKPEVIILGFIPSDQTRFSYNFIFSLVLTILKNSEDHGGRAYSTGLYFGHKAKEILGENRVRRIKDFKKRIDPGNLLNPGKVFGHGLIGPALRLAGLFEPLIRPYSNHIVTTIGERPTRTVRGIPADVAWYAYSCSQCGYCVDECDQFYGRGWESQSPRGKWYWLREYMEGREEWDQFMVDTILVCTTCELCNLRCSAALPIEDSWMKLRGHLIEEEKRMTFPPFEMMAETLRTQGNIWAGYRKDRTAWLPEDLKTKHGPGKKAKTVYFAGCTASYVEKDIAMAGVLLLDTAGVDFTYVGERENCCGTPMLVAGKWDLFIETMKKNIEAIKEVGGEVVVASCPACDMMWRQIYPVWSRKAGIPYDLRVKHYSEVLAEKIRAGEFLFPENAYRPVTVTWHDSCHIGRVSGVYEAPRQLIRAIPNVRFVEMSHNRENAHCCGSVLTLIKDPPTAAEIGQTRLEEALEAGAEKLLCLCPCCEVQFRITAAKKNLPIEVVDLAHFAMSALGHAFPDPNLEVQKQWAVFEGIITLMTPQGFADLMTTLWPELIAAMPAGMESMMRGMAKIPGGLNLMKPMFPFVFPRLLPKMLPKVLPVMLERIRDRIPMPDYMVAQMPELMPKVMGNVMPHMLGDLVPLITQPLMDYLKGKNRENHSHPREGGDDQDI